MYKKSTCRFGRKGQLEISFLRVFGYQKSVSMIKLFSEKFNLGIRYIWVIKFQEVGFDN